MKKKIAFVVAIPGSAQSFLKNHFEQLTKYYDVNLVANFPDEESKKEFEVMGVTCHCAPIMRPISIKNDLKALFALRKLFKKEKFDSVHSVTPKAGLLSAVAGWMAGVPIRIHIYTGQVWATRHGVMRTILKMMDKIISTFDNHILVDGESQRQFLIKEGVLKPENSRVLANGSICGVKLERFNISEEVRKREREKFGFKDDDIVFIFMGRLNHDKGIGELYEAFNRLAPECPKAKLVLYGSDEEGYEAKAKNYPNLKRDVNFFYPGHTSKPFDSLQEGDVFVLPTWREGFGSSVIEAQALGLPAITSDVYGVVDASVGVLVNDERLMVNDERLMVNGEGLTVNDEGLTVNDVRLTVNGYSLTANEVSGEPLTGLRCHVDDSEGLYKCMKTYYDNPDLAKRHGEAGRRRVFDKFDCNLVSKAWVEYYRQLLEG